MWQEIPKKILLSPGQVHVWKADVLTFESNYQRLFSLLSTDEKERAIKFRFEEHRNTYVFGKGLLRTLLGNYLGLDPKSIVFEYNDQSKPFFNNFLNLQFNVSHSKSTILFGFTLNSEIGVDVEFNKRKVEIPEISKRFFSKPESEILLALPSKYWLAGFYNCWTRKEAFIKAKGGGLSLPLDQFEVSLKPGEKAELRKVYWNQGEVQNWKMDTFIYKKDYTAAIIVNSNICSFSYFNCTSLLLH